MILWRWCCVGAGVFDDVVQMVLCGWCCVDGVVWMVLCRW